MCSENLEQSSDLAGKASQLLEEYPFASWHEKTHGYFRDASSVNEKINIACSGGADSVFATLLSWVFLKGQINLIHVNHGVRGANSNRDEGFVKKLARSLACSVSILKLGNLDKSDEGSLRDSRLRLIALEIKKTNSQVLVQGHQADDIAESFLWRLSRGAGPEGLSSPSPCSKHGGVVFLRPFISFSRKQIRQSLQSHSIPWVEDETNLESKYLRNRLRLQVMDSWKANVDRDLLHGIKTSRDLLEEQNEAITEWVHRAFDSVVRQDFIKRKSFNELPNAVKRGVLAKWLSQNGIPFSHKQLSEVLILQSDGVLPQEFNLKGGSFLCITNEDLSIKKPCVPPAPFPRSSIPIGGTLYLPDGASLQVTRESQSLSQLLELLKEGVDVNRNAWISADLEITKAMYCRTRQEGDLYQKLGSSGGKSVKKLMIDHKIPQPSRESLPLILLGKDEIAWIPGLPPSEKFKVKPTTKRVMHLTYSPCQT